MHKLLISAMLLGLCLACSAEDHGKPLGVPKKDGGKDATADSALPDSGKPDAPADADIDAGTDAGADSAADSEPGDAADADAGPIVCNTFSIDGPAVVVSLQSGTPPPATGGTIVAGTYWLTQRDMYGGATAPTDTVRRTLVIDATKLSLAEKADDGDGGPSSERRAEFSYTVSSNGALNTIESCPAPGSIDGVFYTATATELWLFPANDAREVYKLQ